MQYPGTFPEVRLRRNRKAAWARELVAEYRLSASDLVLPLFVHGGTEKEIAIPSMPGVVRHNIAQAVKTAKQAKEAGIPAIALFPVVEPSLKSEQAEEAYNPKNLICQTVQAIKKQAEGIGIICDVALDPYTSHGQDGLVEAGRVVNDETVEVLCKQAIALAQAGCDVVAPSDMMDGRVGKIREALDSRGFDDIQILSYAAKYASAFYGPFRDAVGSAANLGKAGKHTYQMDYRNGEEALREVALDIAEGADMVMIKPGMPYLDIITRVKAEFSVPVLAYQVSGEYAMLKAAAAQGWLNGEAVMLESLLAFKRAGASAIFTYAALDVAKTL